MSANTKPYARSGHVGYITIIDPVILKTMEKNLMREELLEVLEKEVLTEENTDMFIDVVLGFVKLPIWLRWFPLRSILDKALPGAVLAGVRAIVKKNEAQG